MIYIAIPVVIMANEATNFTPLQDNERFAFSLDNVLDNEGRAHWNMTLYAIKDNDTDSVSELFRWQAVRWWDIQFTYDLRKSFFVDNSFLRSGSRAQARSLYMANGVTGEIRRLIADVGSERIRVSKDGRFVVFQGSAGTGHVNIFLFCVESETIVGEFEWRPNSPEWFHIEGWNLRRFYNFFRIYATANKGIIYMIAELKPETSVLETVWIVWDTIETPEQQPVWLDINEEGDWQDDVILQHRNPNIRLRR